MAAGSSEKKKKVKKIRHFRLGSMQLKTKTHDKKSWVQGDSTHRFFFFSEQNAPKKFCFLQNQKRRNSKKDRRKSILLKEIFLFFSLKSVSFFPRSVSTFSFFIQGSVTKGREKDPLFFSEVVCFPTISRSFCTPQN